MDPGRPVHAFHGGASFSAIGVGFDDLGRRSTVVDADVLDAWYEPAPTVLTTLREHLPWLVKTSPPTHGDGLREMIAARHGLDAANVMVGGGTSALMFLALPRLLSADSTVALLDPAYGEYRHIVEHVIGACVAPCELQEQAGFAFDPHAIAAVARDAGASLLILCNPNSPTGTCLDASGLRTLLAELPPRCRVWIDETYIDFVPAVPTTEPLVQQDPRVIVAKSMSKFFALSGLRIGYLAAAREVIAALEPWNPPWSAGLLAQVAAARALQSYDWYRERAVATHALRDALRQKIDAIPGLHCVPSTTNFLMIETGRSSAAALSARCREQGVFLRDCSSLSPRLGDRFIRTAVKDASGNARIAAALARAVAGAV